MKFVISEFNLKVDEINEYFSFIKDVIDSRNETKLYLKNKKTEKEISSNLHKILKANLFLLLYNLVESSFRASLENICDQISNESLKYQDVIPEIKKKWLKDNYKNFDNSKLHKNISKSEFIMNKINDIAEDIIKIVFSGKLISGNIDAKKIKEINSGYGMIIDKTSNSLLTKKNQRNNLAHGDSSFSVCGEKYTLLELQKITNESIDYMKFILNHIKDFLEQKKYIN